MVPARCIQLVVIIDRRNYSPTITAIRHPHIILCILMILTLQGRGQNDEAMEVDTSSTVTYATYYADKFVGRKTTSGEIFSQHRFTAAHKTLPLGTLVRVTNRETGVSVIVKVNDRCPRRGVIDLTKAAAKVLGIGSRKVAIQILPDSYRTEWEAQVPPDNIIMKSHHTKGKHPSNKHKKEIENRDGNGHKNGTHNGPHPKSGKTSNQQKHSEKAKKISDHDKSSSKWQLPNGEPVFPLY